MVQENKEFYESKFFKEFVKKASDHHAKEVNKKILEEMKEQNLLDYETGNHHT